MTPAQAAEALATCAAFDNRTTTEIAARAWSAALADVSLGDAKVAIVAHYRDSRTWLMPSDIRDAVKAMRAARHEIVAHTEGIGTPAPPESLGDDPAGQIAWRRVVNARIGDGFTLEDADAMACRELNATRAQIGTRDATAAIEATTAAMRRIPKAQHRPTSTQQRAA